MRQLARRNEQGAHDLVVEQVLDKLFVLQRSDHAEGYDDDDRADQQNEHVLGESPGKAARLGHVPDVIEARFDLLHHGNGRPDEECKADSSEDTAVDVMDELHDVVRDLDTFLTEWFEQQVHALLELPVNSETLEYRETEGDQRYDRQQGRIDQTHRPHAELAAQHIAQYAVQVAQRRTQDPARQSVAAYCVTPDEFVELLDRVHRHTVIVLVAVGARPSARSYNQACVNRASASRYFSAVCCMTSAGSSGPGAFLSQSSVSR